VDSGLVTGRFLGFSSPRFRDTFSRLFDEVGRILAAYVRGQLLIALCMAVLYAIGFYAFGVPAWAGLAALAGLLADGDGLWRIGGIVGLFVVVQSIEGYILTPRILGRRLSLHPMAVFLGLLIGGKLFGLLGIILAVPTIAIAKVFLEISSGTLYRLAFLSRRRHQRS
jgi:predicted PurR-regulated permease PerM